MNMNELQEQGRQTLREVLGTDYAQRRDDSTNDFNGDIRAASEMFCFGATWGRPGLTRQQRSLLCIAIMTTLGRAEELRLHVIGAVNNGCTVEQIKEVFMHCIIYVGLPTASSAAKVAEGVLRERGLLPAAPAAGR